MSIKNIIKYLVNNSLFCCIVLCICNCVDTHKYKAYQSKISQLTKDGKNIDLVKLIVEAKDFHPDEESAFLKNVEVASYLMNTENYCQAIDFFDNAYNILQTQKTTDISSKLSSVFTGSLDVYKPPIYEQSLIKFYQALMNYKVYSNSQCEKYIELQNNNINKQNVGLSGKELDDNAKKQKFSASRANVLEWDSFLEGREIKKEDRFYSKDLLQKLWGAFIHEQQGSLADKQIARQLYEDAKDVALNRYAVYSKFNKNSEEFLKHLDNIESKKLYLDVDNKYVKDINDYSNKQINRINNNKKANLQIVVFDGLIGEKKEERVTIPASSFFSGDSTLLYASRAIYANNVSFNVPYLLDVMYNNEYHYKITNSKNRVIANDNIVLVEPVSNIAYTTFAQVKSGIISSIVSKIKSNFKSCIIRTIQSEENARKKRSYNNKKMSFWENLAVAAVQTAIDTAITALFTDSYISKYSYAIRNRCYSVLDDKSLYDTRQWVTLPANILLGTNWLDNGKYHIDIVKRSANGNDVVVKQQDFEIKDGNTIFISVKQYNSDNVVVKSDNNKNVELQTQQIGVSSNNENIEKNASADNNTNNQNTNINDSDKKDITNSARNELLTKIMNKKLEKQNADAKIGENKDNNKTNKNLSKSRKRMRRGG